MVNGSPGPAATKLSAAVEAIEALQAWKADLEALMKKTNTFLRLKIDVLEEKVLEQAVQIKYLQEVLEIEVDEGDNVGITIAPELPGVSFFLFFLSSLFILFLLLIILGLLSIAFTRRVFCYSFSFN